MNELGCLCEPDIKKQLDLLGFFTHTHPRDTEEALVHCNYKSSLKSYLKERIFTYYSQQIESSFSTWMIVLNINNKCCYNH